MNVLHIFLILGRTIAENEMKTIILKLLNDYQIDLQEDFSVEIAYDIVIKPRNGVWIKLKPRKNF